MRLNIKPGGVLCLTIIFALGVMGFSEISHPQTQVVGGRKPQPRKSALAVRCHGRRSHANSLEQQVVEHCVPVTALQAVNHRLSYAPCQSCLRAEVHNLRLPSEWHPLHNRGRAAGLRAEDLQSLSPFCTALRTLHVQGSAKWSRIKFV